MFLCLFPLAPPCLLSPSIFYSTSTYRFAKLRRAVNIRDIQTQLTSLSRCVSYLLHFAAIKIEQSKSHMVGLDA
ncbi:hypothetical protein ACTXT7_011040 [Hymenolepis weldensis]